MLDYFDYGDGVSIYLDSGPVMISNDDKRYSQLIKLLENNQEEEVVDLLDINKNFKEDQNLVFDYNTVYYKGEQLPSVLVDWILTNKENEEDISIFLKFWTSLNFNEKFQESFESRAKIYKTLDQGRPLCADRFVFFVKSPIEIENFHVVTDKYYENKIKEGYDLKQLIEENLGFYSKKLENKIKEFLFKENIVNFNILNYGLMLKDIVSIDEFYDFIEKNKEMIKKCKLNQEEMVLGNQMFKVLSKNKSGYSYKKIKKFISIDKHNDLKNCLRKWDQFVYGEDLVLECKDLKELNDFLNKEILKSQHDNFTLNQETHFEELQDLELDITPSIRVEVPKDFHELIFYGQIMGNCIGGINYSKNASKGKIKLLGVFVNNNLKYNLEISKKGEILQFQRKRDLATNRKEKQLVIDHLKKYNVIDKKQ